MRLVGHVACMGENKNASMVLVWKFEGKRPGVDRRKTLNWILKKVMV
jgi:hypothetical protein